MHQPIDLLLIQRQIELFEYWCSTKNLDPKTIEWFTLKGIKQHEFYERHLIMSNLVNTFGMTKVLSVINIKYEQKVG